MYSFGTLGGLLRRSAQALQKGKTGRNVHRWLQMGQWIAVYDVICNTVDELSVR